MEMEINSAGTLLESTIYILDNQESHFDTACGHFPVNIYHDDLPFFYKLGPKNCKKS